MLRPATVVEQSSEHLIGAQRVQAGVLVDVAWTQLGQVVAFAVKAGLMEPIASLGSGGGGDKGLRPSGVRVRGAPNLTSRGTSICASPQEGVCRNCTTRDQRRQP
jgi:hypothetical protein